ncbi:MAG: hypothetical protein ACI970_001155 [Myxococcota bacterium]|jgi:hypothetical protein
MASPFAQHPLLNPRPTAATSGLVAGLVAGPAADVTADVFAVAVMVLGGAREQVMRVVDGGLGWVVVEPGDAVLPARMVVADVAAVMAGVVPEGLARVLLVDANDTPGEAADAARGAHAVVHGVPTAAAFASIVRGLADGRIELPWCTVAGAAGGVGATTIALALGGLRAWQHGPTMVVARGPAHTAGVPAVAGAQVASPAAWAAAAQAVGMPELRVVRLVGAPEAVRIGPVPVVLDVGVAPNAVADVLVARPDVAGVESVSAISTSVVVLIGRGPRSPADVRAAAGGRTVVEVASSHRVARACAAGRMPTDAPGAWLRPLTEVLAQLGGSR